MQKLSFILLIGLASCISFKDVAVFDEESKMPEPDGFGGFYATEIFSDHITSEIWFSPEAKCLSVETTSDVKRNGESSLHFKWDKISQSCEWLGIGFGWDGWSGKDLKPVINDAAIEMWVRNKEGSRSGLPLAVCLEDYSGGQAWIGVSANAIVGKEINEEWTQVRLPFCEFEWNAVNGANPSNIKQLLIQFEADGDIYVDDIKVVKFNGSYRKRANVDLNTDALEIDGIIGMEWGNPILSLDDNPVYMKTDNEFIYLAAIIADNSPLGNSQVGADIWNGDALEIAFSSDYGAGNKRGYLKTTDQHFGIKLSGKPSIWNWRKNEEISETEVKVVSKNNLVTVEAKIPMSSLGSFTFNPNVIYGFEAALDQGTLKGRDNQVRWNSSNNEGFNQNPGMWGEAIFRNK